MCDGWAIYNQAHPLVGHIHPRYKYNFENESQIAKLADAIVEIKPLRMSKQVIESYTESAPCFGFFITKVKIMKVYKSTQLKENQIINFIEPYYAYTNPGSYTKFILTVENYKPMEKGRNYIVFVNKFDGDDPKRFGGYEPIRAEYGKYLINKKFRESIDAGSLTVDDYDIYKHDPIYEKIFCEVMRKYK